MQHKHRELILVLAPISIISLLGILLDYLLRDIFFPSHVGSIVIFLLSLTLSLGSKSISLSHWNSANKLLILLSFSNHVVLYGTRLAWVSFYYHSASLHRALGNLQILENNLLLVVQFLIIIAFSSLQLPGVIGPCFWLEMASAIVLLGLSQVFTKTTQFQCSKILAKVLTQQIQETFVKVFDSSLNELASFTPSLKNPIERPRKLDCTDPLFTDRSSKAPILEESLTRWTYKLLHLNDTTCRSIDSNRLVNRKSTTYDDYSELLKDYILLGQPANSLLSAYLVTKHKRIEYQLVVKTLESSHYAVIFEKRSEQLYQQYRYKHIKFKNYLVSIFNHKLKTPLNATLNYLSSSVAQHNDVSILNAFINSKVQLFLIQDLLDFVLKESDLINLHITRFNLKTTLLNVAQLIDHQCKAKNLTLKIMINFTELKEYEQTYLCMTDQLKLERVLFNILNDAYRYSNTGQKITLNVQTDVVPQVLRFGIFCHFYMTDDQLKEMNLELDALNSPLAKFWKAGQVSVELKIAHQLVGHLSDRQNWLKLIRCPTTQSLQYEFDILQTLKPKYRCVLEGSKSWENLMKARSKDKIQGLQPPKAEAGSRGESGYPSLLLVDEELVEREPVINNFPVRNYSQKVRSKLKATRLESYKMTRRQSLMARTPLKQESMTPKNRKGIAESLDIQADFSKTVMIVDDEPFNHDILKMMLKGLGFQKFHCCFNGYECIQEIEKLQGSLGVIFMDLDMPVMNGINTTKVLVEMMEQGNLSFVPIVACTAYDDIETQKQCFEAGMVHIVAKPVFRRSLQEAFARISERVGEWKGESIKSQ